MNFCTNCNNMYYIRLTGEDEDKLVYYCRKCGHEDTSLTASLDNMCVSHSDKKTTSSYDHIINKYTKLDPTLPRLYNIKCPNESCLTNIKSADESKDESKDDSKDKSNSNEVLYVRYDDTNMKFVYMCTECDTIWKSADDI